ncbi:cuticle protein 19.8-like [Culicoides brevitarsis]|uniref:cuticle protein 19.8-like n=1 Tax=Culicoides brevitarsis TaxID=469753 RepID=UPI00307CA76B
MKNVTLIIIVITSYVNNLAIGQRTQFYTDFKSGHKQNEIDYSFRYYIDAPSSGVVMDHWEDRKGDSVQGRYSLVEPEGSVRTVYYTVDKGSGFKAAIKLRMPGSTQFQSFGRLNSELSSPSPPVKPYRHAEPIAFVLSRK